MPLSTFTASNVANITSTTTQDAGGGSFTSTSEFSSKVTFRDYGDAPDSGAGTGTGNYEDAC